MAVYGDQLSFFPELFVGFKNYKINPLLVSGRDERQFITSFRGILQYIKVGELDREGNTLNPTLQPTLWTRNRLKQGTFVVPEDSPEELYVINKANPYKREGDFIIYILETSNTSSDSHQKNEDFSYGQDSFE